MDKDVLRDFLEVVITAVNRYGAALASLVKSGFGADVLWLVELIQEGLAFVKTLVGVDDEPRRKMGFGL